jgi:hypothetical protein
MSIPIELDEFAAAIDKQIRRQAIGTFRKLGCQRAHPSDPRVVVRAGDKQRILRGHTDNSFAVDFYLIT